jgi:hypothetical protein
MELAPAPDVGSTRPSVDYLLLDQGDRSEPWQCVAATAAGIEFAGRCGDLLAAFGGGVSFQDFRRFAVVRVLGRQSTSACTALVGGDRRVSAPTDRETRS